MTHIGLLSADSSSVKVLDHRRSMSGRRSNWNPDIRTVSGHEVMSASRIGENDNYELNSDSRSCGFECIRTSGQYPDICWPERMRKSQ